MKLAWFTPLSARTGIARYSATVVNALSGFAEVEVWAPPSSDPVRVRGCTVHEFLDPDDAVRATASCDLRVFNLANHPDYAAAIYAVYERSGGMVILHDKVMQDFFFHGLTPPAYYRLMTYLYGDRGSVAAVQALGDGSRLSDADFVGTFPLLEACLYNAEGVLTHSVHAGDLARERYGVLVPVRSMQLPLFAHEHEESGTPPPDRTELGVPRDRVLIVATGRVAHSKRIDTVIDAIAGSETLRGNCLFVSVGEAEPDYLAGIEARIASLGMSESARLVTRADDRLLHGYLDAADVCVNLRHPSTEASSATLVEQLYAGKPIVVYDTGVYAELPDDVVAKVPVGSGVDGVREALTRLVDDSGARLALGRRARDYAEAECDPIRFARALAEFAEHVVANRPVLAALDDRVSRIGTPSTIEAMHAAAVASVAGMTP